MVGRVDFAALSGDSTVTLAFNYNDTTVDNRGSINPISDGRVEALEDQLPSIKGNVAWAHTQGRFRTLVRANYYGGWKSTSNDYNVGATIMVDAQVSYQLSDELELVLGVDNLFDEYPDSNPGQGGVGQLYPEDSPFGFNGGSWYLQGRYSF